MLTQTQGFKHSHCVPLIEVHQLNDAKIALISLLMSTSSSSALSPFPPLFFSFFKDFFFNLW